MFVSPHRVFAWLLCLVVPSGSVYLSVNRSPDIRVFTLSGSASMRPMMVYLLSRITNNKITSTVASTGSSTGLKQLMTGVSDFALVSHDVELAVEEEGNKSKWKEKRLKSITLAREAIFLVYKPPKGCEKDLVLSSSNIEDVYSVFSGYTNPNTRTNLKDWISSGSSQAEFDQKCNATVRPWVKSSGPTKSGTAKTFVNNPLLDTLKSQEGKSDWVQKVREGYGSEGELYFAHESNFLHWNAFKQGLRPGFATYFPSSFYFRNKIEMEKLGLRKAKIKHSDQDGEKNIEEFENTKDERTNYKWGRTLNLIFSMENMDELKRAFINEMMQKLPELERIKFDHSETSQKLTIEINGNDDCTGKTFGETFGGNGSTQDKTCDSN